jgi:hypothetical protein
MPAEWPQIEDLADAKVGQPLGIPAGTRVRSLHPRDPVCITTKRGQLVTPHFVDRYRNRRGEVDHIVVTWAGGGGYWKRVEAKP